MVRASVILRILFVGLVLTWSGAAWAQEDVPVTLVTPGGSHVPFTILHHGTDLLISSYAGDVSSPASGLVMMDIGGTITPVPVDRLARADTIHWAGEPVWRYTLKDGRTFVAPRGQGANYFLWITGLNEFGVR